MSTASNAKPHLLHVFPSFSTGGAQVRTCDLLNHFGPAYRHSIVALDDDFSARDRLDAGLDVDYVHPGNVTGRTIRDIRLFRRLLASTGPDLLLTYNWGTIEWAMANFAFPLCPQVHGEDGFGPDEVSGQKVARVLCRRAFLSRCFALVAPSRNLERIARNTWRIAPGKIRYIPNGVDCRRFSRRKGARGRTVIGTLATLRPEKNIQRLLRVFAGLGDTPGAELWIIGDGPELPALKEYAANHGLSDRTVFWGYTADPAPLLAEVDVLAVSSDTEQMPISVVEGMASSCAIISTDVGDVMTMVCDENRRCIVPRDGEALYRDRMHELIADSQARSDLGRRNRDLCEQRYDIGLMFASYAQLYQAALASARRR